MSALVSGAGNVEHAHVQTARAVLPEETPWTSENVLSAVLPLGNAGHCGISLRRDTIDAYIRVGAVDSVGEATAHAVLLGGRAGDDRKHGESRDEEHVVGTKGATERSGETK